MFQKTVIAALALAVVVTGTTLIVQTQSANEAETSVQIAARRLEDGRVEFGLRHRMGVDWSDLRFPTQRFLSADAEVDEWVTSNEIAVPVTRIDVRLRDGVHVGDYRDEFLVYIDGQVYETNCGDLQLEIITDNVIFSTRDEACDAWIGLATACGSAEAACDVQQAMIYSWESAQRQRYGFEEIDLTIDEAQAIVDAVWHDYVRGGREPPTLSNRPTARPPAFTPHLTTRSTYRLGDETSTPFFTKPHTQLSMQEPEVVGMTRPTLLKSLMCGVIMRQSSTQQGRDMLHGTLASKLPESPLCGRIPMAASM